MKLPYQIRKIFGIKVFALVGRSGTGKSFRARLLAEKYGIELIIDDGLLIKGDRIIAGKSAKNEKLYLTAIKTALFDTAEHCMEVRNRLREEEFSKILILGTSDAMVQKITKRLLLPKPRKIIRIEEIASAAEIENALSERASGRHVIPIPAVEVEKNYSDIISGYISETIQWGMGLFGCKKRIEKTVVRPTFTPDEKSKRVVISKSELMQTIVHYADEFDSSIKVRKIRIKSDPSGFCTIKMSISASYKTQLSGNFHNFGSYISQSLTRYTGIHVKKLDVDCSTPLLLE